jgi:hypothetical protein
MRHQYEGFSHHDVYPSGIVGDESGGKIGGALATLDRVADTYMASSSTIGFPYPSSVRGSFRGFVFMNPSVLDGSGSHIDGLIQIISPADPKAGHLVNGIFYGTFRGVLEDTDADGSVELNGVDMLVNADGTVNDPNPPSGQQRPPPRATRRRATRTAGRP